MGKYIFYQVNVAGPYAGFFHQGGSKAYSRALVEGKNLPYRGTIPFCLHIVP
jgi:hypothetical protein